MKMKIKHFFNYFKRFLLLQEKEERNRRGSRVSSRGSMNRIITIGGGLLFLSITSYNYSFCNNNNENENEKVYDIAVIGSGVVGLSVARSCLIQTNIKSIVIIDKEDVINAGVSSRNSGLGCTGYDAPIGSLERHLLRRSIRRHQNLYRSFGLSHNHVRKCGSLVVAWNEEELLQLPKILQENREAGDFDAILLTQKELHEFEPNLSKNSLGAVYCPYESVVEPWLVPMGYAESCRLNGAEFKLGNKVIDIKYNNNNNYWQIHSISNNTTPLARSKSGELLIPYHSSKSQTQLQNTNNVLNAKVVINCGGLFSDEIEKMIRKEIILSNNNINNNNNNNEDNNIITNQGSYISPFPTSQKSSFTIQPRKGQFLVYKLPDDSPFLKNQISTIEPVATQFTKGVIIWQTMYNNIIVGPTATDIPEKEDYQTTLEVLTKLKETGERVYPFLKDCQIIGSYSGIRPATEYRDYQIYSNEYKLQDQNNHNSDKNVMKWITVGGIRSTGLTASSGIGEYVAELYCNLLTKDSTLKNTSKSFQNDLKVNNSIAEDGLLGISICASSPLSLNEINKNLITNQVNNSVINCPTIPSIEELAKDFQQNIKLTGNNPAEGTVTLFGRKCRVTHPIASFGMETYHLNNNDNDNNSERNE